VPLPAGWTARVERAFLDRSHAPPYVRIEFAFLGPGGVVLRHQARVLQSDVQGLTLQGIVNVAWPTIRDYVFAAIQDYSTWGPAPQGNVLNAAVNIP
jgi:hypothetical protein